MEAGGKIKGSGTHKSDKPYTRSSGLFGRMSESVKDMLSPSWLVDLVSSVKKKSPPLDSEEQAQTQQQCSGYASYAASRPMPDLSNTYNSPHVTPSVPSYNTHIQHSTPVPHSQEPLHFTSSAMTFAGLNKLDLQSNMLMNGNDDHTELSEFAPSTSSYNQNRQQQSSVGSVKYLTEGQSKIQQLRQELGGSVTPSKEIEERAKLQSQMSESKAQKVQEPSFLWANESKREIKKTDPQPPAKRHKPNFNSSVFGATTFSQSADASLQSTSYHNSSFYSGKTMFGGASANTSRARQATPTRKQVTVKSATGSKAGVTSSAAKRILDCLERMSTPLSDCKKIPSYKSSNSSLADSPLSFTPGIYRRRSLRHAPGTNGPPIGNLSTPIQASIGPNLQKPAQARNLHRVAMKQAGTTGAGNSESSTSDLDRAPKDSGKTGGKMKRERSTFHIKRPDDDDEQVEAPVLPTAFTLPMSDNLPKFDFIAASNAASLSSTRPEFTTSSPIVETGDVSMTSDLFTFSSPIAQSAESITVQSDSSQKAFTFSSPISVDQQTPAMEVSSVSGIISSAPTLAFCFQPSPKLKVKQKTNTEEEPTRYTPSGLKPASELKKGGVMDFLGKSPVSTTHEFKAGSVMDVLGKKNAPVTAAKPVSVLLKASSSSWSCPTCMHQNIDSMEKCPSCETAKPGTAKKMSVDSSSKTVSKIDSSKPLLSSVFKHLDSGWSCPTCMVRNMDAMEKCPCCETAKPQAKKSTAAVSSTKIDSTSDKPPLSSLFKAQSGWSCPTCMVQNDDGMVKCPCCETAKPGAKLGSASQSATKPEQASTEPLSSMFKKPVGNWHCDTCMVSNKKDASKCIACETPKPGLKTSSSFTSAGGFSGIKFGTPSSSTSDTKSSNTNTSATSANTSLKTGFSFGVKASSDKDTASTGPIKFGLPVDKDKTSASNTASASAGKDGFGGFKFGASASTATDKPTGSVISFGTPKSVSTEKKDTNPSSSGKPIFGDVKTNTASTSDAPKSTFGGYTFGGKPASGDNGDNSLGGFNFETDSSNQSAKPIAAVGGVQFGTKADVDKDKTVSSSAPGYTFDTVVSSANSTTTKPGSSVVASSGMFRNSAATSDSKPETTKPNDNISSSSAPVFGSGASIVSSTSTTTSTPSGGFAFGGTNSSSANTNTTTGGFNFSAKPVGASALSGSVSTSSSFGGFRSATPNTQPAATNNGASSGFSFTAANTTVATADTNTTTLTSSGGFGGFGTAKASESQSASDLFVFGQAAKSDSSDTVKPPMVAPLAGGFGFGGTSATAAAPTAPSNGGMFVFGGTKTNDTAPLMSSNLKRGRDATANDGVKDAKKGAFGSAGASIFGQQANNPSSIPSVFGSSTFGGSAVATTTPAPVFGATTAPAPAGFGAPSTVFGGAIVPQAGAGFTFGAPTKPLQPSTGTSNPFGFGTNQVKNQSNSNSNPFAQATQPTATPTFGSHAAQPAPSQPAAAGGFNFSASATPNFNFSAGSNAPAPSGGGGFQFSAQPVAGANMFNATSSSSTSASTRRPIKKAIRRTARK